MQETDAHGVDDNDDDDGNGDGDADEWEQWPEEDSEISSSDNGKAGTDSGDSMYEEAGAGPQTRAQRQARHRQKRERPSAAQGGQHSRKRRRMQSAQYAVDVSDDEDELYDLEEVQ